MRARAQADVMEMEATADVVETEAIMETKVDIYVMEQQMKKQLGGMLKK